MHGAKGGKNIREVIALEVELKGNSIPYSVLLHPPAIVIPGSVLEGTTVKRPLKIANYRYLMIIWIFIRIRVFYNTKY